MNVSRKNRLLLLPAAATLVAVSLTGCSDTGGVSVSRVKACADIVKTSASRLGEISANRNDPAKAAEIARSAAQELRTKAAQADDPQVRRAVAQYVRDLRGVARQAQQTGSIDADAVKRATTALAGACA